MAPLAVPSQRTFVVSGIYSSGFSEFDATYILGDIQHIRTMNQWEADTYGNYEVFITDFDSLENLTQTLYQQTPSTLDVQNISEKFYDIFSWLALFDMNILIIIVIMILVGGVNMITALLVLILERTQMIGVLTVLGSSQWSIRKVFLYNARDFEFKTLYKSVKTIQKSTVIVCELFLFKDAFSLLFKSWYCFWQIRTFSKLSSISLYKEDKSSFLI
jgi:lipoprotein-releasing system permease protein